MRNNVPGNSATATKLQVKRSIKLTGVISGETIFDGSQNASIETQINDLEIIEGSIIIEANSSGDAILDYPNGLNENNCVPVATGIKYNSKGYNYVGIKNDSSDMLMNAFKRTLTLTSDNIVLRIENSMTEGSKTFYFKIVLRKIKAKEEEYVLGDVNGDGSITKEDADMIQKYLMGEIALTTKQYKAADMNKDGTVSSSDYVLLKNQIGL